VIGAALRTLVPLILFVFGIWLIFTQLKAKWLIVLVTLGTTALLFASPIGPPLAHWLNGIANAAGLHDIHL
jgi:hypothetical protein